MYPYDIEKYLKTFVKGNHSDNANSVRRFLNNLPQINDLTICLANDCEVYTEALYTKSPADWMQRKLFPTIHSYKERHKVDVGIVDTFKGKFTTLYLNAFFLDLCIPGNPHVRELLEYYQIPIKVQEKKSKMKINKFTASNETGNVELIEGYDAAKLANCEISCTELLGEVQESIKQLQESPAAETNPIKNRIKKRKAVAEKLIKLLNEMEPEEK